jgi:hypothetical protein
VAGSRERATKGPGAYLSQGLILELCLRTTDFRPRSKSLGKSAYRDECVIGKVDPCAYSGIFVKVDAAGFNKRLGVDHLKWGEYCVDLALRYLLWIRRGPRLGIVLEDARRRRDG